MEVILKGVGVLAIFIVDLLNCIKGVFVRYCVSDVCIGDCIVFVLVDSKNS